MKKVLVISSTPRKGGNSEKLAERFLEGARSAGHDAELVCLRDLKIGYCTGCYACAKTGKCARGDDMAALAEKILAADVIALATPVYFYTMSAQLKTMIDRLVPYYRRVRSDIYLFCTAADTENLGLTLESMRGCTRDCLTDCTEKGALAVGGVFEVGEIAGRPELDTAFDMGRDC